MKVRGDIKTRIKIALIILLILLPLSAIIHYSTVLSILKDDSNGNQIGEDQIRTIKFEEIGHFYLEKTSVIEVTDEFAWIGSPNGLYRYDPGTGQLLNFNESQGLLSNYVTSIEVDDDIVWIGNGLGISLYDQSERSWSNFTIETGLGHRGYWVVDIIIDDNHVWVAAEGNWQYTMGVRPFGGISCFDKRSGTWTVYNSSNGCLIDDNIKAIAKEGDKIWMATLSDIYLFNASERVTYIWNKETLTWRNKTEKYWPYSGISFSYTNSRISEIAVAKDELVIWPVYPNDIEIHYLPTDNRTILKQERYVSDIEIENEHIFFGTSNGVKIYNRSNNDWKVINESHGLLNNVVSDIEIFNDQLWVASKDGVNIYQISYVKVTGND